MRKLSLNQASGFKVKDGTKCIVESLSEGWKYIPLGQRFNLPAGVYNINGDVREFELYKYPRFDLGKADKVTDFSAVKIAYINNPAKASIYVKTGQMFLDLDYWNRSLPKDKKFLMLHELGHYALNGGTEKKANEWASNRMLDLGYNPTNITECYTRFDNKLSRLQCFESAKIFINQYE